MSQRSLVIAAGLMLIVPSHMARSLHKLEERQAQIEEGVARDIAAWEAGEPLRPLLVRHRNIQEIENVTTVRPACQRCDPPLALSDHD